jgi:hypothetical protein
MPKETGESNDGHHQGLYAIAKSAADEATQNSRRGLGLPGCARTEFAGRYRAKIPGNINKNA